MAFIFLKVFSCSSRRGVYIFFLMCVKINIVRAFIEWSRIQNDGITRFRNIALLIVKVLLYHVVDDMQVSLDYVKNVSFFLSFT